MAVRNAPCIKSRLLKLPVDVAGENETAMLHRRRRPKQNAEVGMENGRAIESEAVSLESPAQTQDCSQACGVTVRLSRDIAPGQPTLEGKYAIHAACGTLALISEGALVERQIDRKIESENAANPAVAN